MLSEITLSRQPENIQANVFALGNGTRKSREGEGAEVRRKGKGARRQLGQSYALIFFRSRYRRICAFALRLFAFLPSTLFQSGCRPA